MAQQTDAKSPSEEPFAPEPQRTAKPRINIDEIVQSFESVTQDIVQIGKLTTEEKTVFSQFLKSLKTHLEPLTKPIQVSTSIIPIDLGMVNQAYIKRTGHLELIFVDGRQALVDLSDPKNRDLMMAVIDDVMPKFEALIREIQEEKRHPKRVEIPAPKPAPPVMPEPLPPAIPVQPPVVLPQPAPVIEAPKEPEPPKIEPPPDPFAERNAKIEAITSETLTYLDMLGGEVFEQEPVSKYFDDWMVNLRQVILSFESNAAIGADEAFNSQYNQIFGKIQEELDNRVALEGDMAVSYRTLVENRYLLNKIDEEHAAQTKEFVEKGASNIETLMQSMQNIEKELAEVQAIKTSYRHPLQKMAKDQKVAELTQRLNSVKRRLAMAVGTSSTDGGKSGDLDSQFEAQTKVLEGKRKIAMELLNKNVEDLINEIAKLKMVKTSNPIKRVSLSQQAYELEEKLADAKKRLTLAEQSSSDEMKKLKEEYEKKKEAALGKVQTLEKDIAKKAVDNSAGVRKDAAKALSEAVKTLSQKRLTAKDHPVADTAAPSLQP